MTEETKPKRPRARRVVRVPTPSQVENRIETTQKHPFLWVECFGCSGQVQMEVDSKKAVLPEGWATVYPEDRSSPDRYASKGCYGRAADRLAHMINVPTDRIVVEPWMTAHVSPQEG